MEKLTQDEINLIIIQMNTIINNGTEPKHIINNAKYIIRKLKMLYDNITPTK